MQASKPLERFVFVVGSALVAVGLALPAGAQTLLDVLGMDGDCMSTALRPAGDFDRDGFPDVLVSADQRYKDVSRPRHIGGGVGILSGRNGSVLFRVSGDDYTALTGRPSGLFFGGNCAMVGDLDRDGVCDVLVVRGSSKVLRYLVAFSGRTRGILFEISDPYGHTDFGDSLRALGDLIDPQGNLVPDGVPDFAVGAPSNPVSVPPPTYPGLVRIYSGATPQSGPVVTLVGAFPLCAFGASLALVGDLDGDGRPALAVGAPGGGYVEVYDGPGFASWYVINPAGLNNALFGAALADLGDIDGDGTLELGVGAPGAGQGAGRVLVFSLAPAGATQLVRLDPDGAVPGTAFGTLVASLPVDPLTGRGLLDLDHDGSPDPFFDWNRDGRADYLIGAPGFTSLAGETAVGGVYLVAGTGAASELAREPIHQGLDHPQLHSYLPARIPRAGEWFGWRMTLLGNAAGESQTRMALGTPRDEDYRGGLVVLRPPLQHFDDDTFSIAADVVGTSRRLQLDFGPRHAGLRFYLLGSAAGTSPGIVVQGFPIALNDDGPGGLWRHTLAGTAAGTPLAFSQLTGFLDPAGRATITLQVTGTSANHPWFDTLRQHYLVVLTQPGQPGTITHVSAPTPLLIF